MHARTSAHQASEALASVRAQNPQLADKLQLATGPAEQLALFAAPRETPPKAAVSLGLKDHDWDRQHPISKTVYSVVLFCKRCKAHMRIFRAASPQYATPSKQGDGPVILAWSYRRPVCSTTEARHG